MAKYELALVVNARIEEEKRLGVLDRAKSYIERFGGTLGATEAWGKKRLAYEIRKMHEGYYYFVRFEGKPETPNELEQNMRIMDDVLRYLIVRLDDDAEIGEPTAAEELAEAEAEETAEVAEEAVEEAAEAAEEVVEEAAEAVEEAAEAVEEAAEAVQE